MVEDWVIKTMYATKRRRRTVKSVKTPSKDPPKSNPSKRHRLRLNSELDHLASLLPFEQSVISKLDKLSILRLAVSFLRTKTYFQAVLPSRYGIENHLLGRSHLFTEPGFSEGESILQALYGFLFVVSCDGEVFFASRTVEQYLGFHQSDIIHQSVMELIHSEDREEFKRQLGWSSCLPPEKSNMSLHEILLPENHMYLHRSFTVRFRCLLDNTSGFITLEISGWLRVLHGQCNGNRTEEPQLALFAICCPFGPLSLFDIPSRELTFKSKHKMDFSPITMDSRGKVMFGYADHELSPKSGYDLVHPDDLTYFSSAHQELIKTGSSGLIAYRWMTKDFRWCWLQSSCKVVYKNSKPDFIIATHRQLTDDEGQDLFGKRGNEFKLPYPLLDMDLCGGFGFPEDEFSPKSKSSKSKKKAQTRETAMVNKKRKGACLLNGLPGYSPYPPFNSYDTNDYKADIIYPYGSNNYGYETDIYRSHGYSSLPAPLYPTTDSYRFDGDKHGLTNGYFYDHRQYQPTLPYSSNTFTDIMTPANKYGYDVPKYGFDPYSIDLSKKVHCGDDISHMDSDIRKYGYDLHERFPRLNGSLEPVDLRSSSVYNPNPYMNPIEGSVAPSCVPPSHFYKPAHTPSMIAKDKSSENVIHHDLPQAISLGHNSVIKSTNIYTSSQLAMTDLGSSPNHHLTSVAGVISQSKAPNNNNNNNNCLSWNSSTCDKRSQYNSVNTERELSPGQPNMVSPDLSVGKVMEHSVIHRISPKCNTSQTSVIQARRSCDKQTASIPVPVVKSPWLHHCNNTHSNYQDNRDWTGDLYGYCGKSQRVILPETFQPEKLASVKETDPTENPLLTFSEVTHTLLSTAH
ncbi:uncharacterized protein LOC126810627 [Patella vulgata]|uniref:uncharacterized protein LOC126810627 n=1 Tax=Patella vulgata TaxID=6465 RepID=UPI0024A806AF|nr:uncharacterized protein LOC126810627 [Patella vulgata]